MAKRFPVVIRAEPRSDGALSVVEVSEREAVLSNGEVLFVRYEKARALCEQMCQEQAAIRGMRTWWTPDGNELIELHRAGEPSTPPTFVTTEKSEAF